ncbi:MAG: carboxymuconolactone decarboxylase family protein [Candidatus Acidiferrales bacterium]
MEPRLNAYKIAPQAYPAVAALQKYVDSCGLERPLLELVRLRTSQINGCAFCLDMHTKDARALGETEQRLYLISAWRESPFYTDRERAALEWTEAVTLVSETHVPDDVYDRVKQHFTPLEIVNLTAAIAMINTWNRLSVAFRAVPGTYQSNLQELKSGA